MYELWIYRFEKKEQFIVLVNILALHIKRIANQRSFVLIVTSARHLWLSTIYPKHNYFPQSNLGRDVELQNTYIVRFNSPRDVMQVSTPRAQLGLGSELVDWYGDATSVPSAIYWLTCRHEQTIDYLVVQAPDALPQSFISRTGLNIQI